MTFQTYSLTRVIDGGHTEFTTSFTTSDDDAINCAHMLAAGFNTMSRNFMGDFALAVVDTKDGTALDEPEPSQHAHVNRDVLESAYGELEDVKSVLFDAGVETIPADAGVRDLLAVKRAMSEQIAKLTHEREQANAAARDELIEFARGAYEKLCKVDPEGTRDDLQNRYRGTLDVLANLLVATGEADRDEKHAVARRLVENLEEW